VCHHTTLTGIPGTALVSGLVGVLQTLKENWPAARADAPTVGSAFGFEAETRVRFTHPADAEATCPLCECCWQSYHRLHISAVVSTLCRCADVRTFPNSKAGSYTVSELGQ